MIYFVADDHYDSHPGAVLHEAIRERFDMQFYENDATPLERPEFADRCSLLMLNLIAGTCNQPLASAKAEVQVRRYLEQGKPLLLLHGASAAFWHWDWWRGMVGYRWVRGNDPDGVAVSTHPTRPYRLEVCKCRHPLAGRLSPIDMPEDEIYINLEQTCPTMTLMQTTLAEGTFPQVYEAKSPWGGKILGSVPGHRPEAVRHPQHVNNVAQMIEYLLA